MADVKGEDVDGVAGVFEMVALEPGVLAALVLCVTVTLMVVVDGEVPELLMAEVSEAGRTMSEVVEVVREFGSTEVGVLG